MIWDSVVLVAGSLVESGVAPRRSRVMGGRVEFFYLNKVVHSC